MAPCWLMMKGWSWSPINASVAFGDALIFIFIFILPFIPFIDPIFKSLVVKFCTKKNVVERTYIKYLVIQAP